MDKIEFKDELKLYNNREYIKVLETVYVRYKNHMFLTRENINPLTGLPLMKKSLGSILH